MKANHRETRAKSQLEIDRINAETALIRSYVGWRKSVHDADLARLDHLIARYGSYETDQMRAEISLKKGAIDLRGLRQKVESLTDPQLRETMSANQIRDLELRLQDAESAYQRAKLNHVAALRKRDWLSVWDAQEAARSAVREATAQRMLYSIGGETYRLSLRQAQERYRYEKSRADDERQNAENETIRSPRDGRVFYHGRHGRQPKIGERVPGPDLFVIPIGPAREFEVEVPARLYDKFEIGQPVKFVAPALGLDPREGEVKRMSSSFMPSAAAEEEHFVRGTIGMPRKVFKMVIAFELAEEELDRGPPGITAYVDL